MKTIWLTALFGGIVPIGLLAGLAAVFIQFWVQKGLMFGRYSRPPMISKALNEDMIELL
jgi:hypothetical protein